MKRLGLWSLLTWGVLLQTVSFSARCNEYAAVDSVAKLVPANLQTVSEIAQHLAAPHNQVEHKLRAFYVWLAHNIAYSKEQEGKERWYHNDEEILQEALKNREGVCQHYADLFHAFCKIIGVESYKVRGYAKPPYGQLPRIIHVWNAVRVEGEFYFIDATWAAGISRGKDFVRRFNDIAFWQSPEQFIKTHMPFDPLWQFLLYPVSHLEFLEFKSATQPKLFHYRDTLYAMPDKTELERLLSVQKRLEPVLIPALTTYKRNLQILIDYQWYVRGTALLNEIRQLQKQVEQLHTWWGKLFASSAKQTQKSAKASLQEKCEEFRNLLPKFSSEHAELATELEHLNKLFEETCAQVQMQY